MRRMLFSSVILGAMVCLWDATAVGSVNDSIYRFRPGLHISRKQCLSSDQSRSLIKELRRITGFDLRIDRDDNVVFTDQQRYSAGSRAARELISAAIDSSDSFTIAATNHSPTVAFAQLESVLSYRDESGNKREDWQIRIDFADFEELRGERQTLDSFGTGFGVLHELVHALLNYPDPVTANDQLGQCERYLNTIREELGLPQRLAYYPLKQLTMSVETQLPTIEGRLLFGWPEEMRSKRTETFLRFNLGRVYELTNAKSRATIITELIAERARR